MTAVALTSAELFALAAAKAAPTRTRTTITPRKWAPEGAEMDALILEVGRGADLMKEGRVSRVIGDKVLVGSGFFHRARADMVHVGRGQPRQKFWLTEKGVARFLELAEEGELPEVQPVAVPLSVYRQAMGLEKGAKVTEVVLVKAVASVPETEVTSETPEVAEIETVTSEIPSDITVPEIETEKTVAEVVSEASPSVKEVLSEIAQDAPKASKRKETKAAGPVLGGFSVMKRKPRTA